MPWQPHGLDGTADRKTLIDIKSDNAVIDRYYQNERLLFYNLITGEDPNPEDVVTPVTFGSGDILVCLLARVGVRKIRTVGLDGGSSYAKSFENLKPLKFGANTYSAQKPAIDNFIKSYGLDFAALD
jgi:hypothetical protein